MSILKRLYRYLFGPKDDRAWVIVEFSGAIVRLYNQETIDWFFGSNILDGVKVERLSINRGSVDCSKKPDINWVTVGVLP